MISDSKPKAHDASFSTTIASSDLSDFAVGSTAPPWESTPPPDSSKDFDKANELRLAPFSPPKVDDLFPADCPLGLDQKLSALSPEMRALVSQRDLPAARRDRIISIALRTIYPALDKNG